MHLVRSEWWYDEIIFCYSISIAKDWSRMAYGVQRTKNDHAGLLHFTSRSGNG